MGKLRDAVGQQHSDFESPGARRARATLDQFDVLQEQMLIDALIENGIYRNKDELRAEYRAGLDPHASDFGGEYAYADFLKNMKSDWTLMLQMICDGEAKNGVEAREKLYGGSDVVTIMRRNRARVRNVLDQPKPR